MRQYALLDRIQSPEDLKALSTQQLPELCSEIREFLIENVSKTGGHLASNLGAVEITVGLHRVFSSPRDKLLFDVGHQCYIHKMITGRKDRFNTLRSYGGLSGFLRPNESDHDCFVTGHASNSISASLGIARARRLAGEDYAVVCVIGDGAFTGGMAYEALNDAGESGEPLIVVFNDNEMSISKNVGALSQRLSRMRSKPQYFRLKSKVKRFFRRLKGGEKMISHLSAFKKRIRAAILKETLFEILGFKYLGPADGNDISTVCYLLQEAKNMNCPVVVHLKTVKGKGYLRSEHNPGGFHGVSAFDVVTGKPNSASGISFSNVFGANLCAMAESDSRICAVTAAMEVGTGLTPFAKRFPDRFFDVGIAEEHAVTMAAGLASRGMRPVCAIYSTFLQRAYDQLIHDVAIAGWHVVLAVDRAGLVGEDGETHQGVFDVPFLLSIPGIKILAPSSHMELQAALKQALYEESGPVAVRYPRGNEQVYQKDTMRQSVAKLYMGEDLTLVTYGIMVNQAIDASNRLADQGISCDLLKINCLSSFDWETVRQSAQRTGRIIVLEDCVGSGCLGQGILSRLTQDGVQLQYSSLLHINGFVPAGKVSQLYQHCQIDADCVIACALEGVAHGR